MASTAWSESRICLRTARRRDPTARAYAARADSSCSSSSGNTVFTMTIQILAARPVLADGPRADPARA